MKRQKDSLLKVTVIENEASTVTSRDLFFYSVLRVNLMLLEGLGKPDKTESRSNIFLTPWL